MKTTLCTLGACALASAGSNEGRLAVPQTAFVRGAGGGGAALLRHRSSSSSSLCSTRLQHRCRSTRSAATVRRSTVVATLDLKPAFSVYATLPVGSRAQSEEGVELDASKPAPFPSIDAFEMVKEDLAPFTDSIKELVDTQHPVLSMAAKHFFERRHGKRFRPTIVCLMSRAVSEQPYETLRTSQQYKRQGQLGTITEMIHVASLIHDDVLDEAETRRGGLAVHKLYSNKVAVLAGDYLLARASVLLARLNNVQVVEIMATALDSLVQGEIMQLQSAPEDLLDMSHYLKKSYYKTASLICSACKSAALLGGHDFDSDLAVAAEEYGYHMGLAFQIVDDILDVTAGAEVLGKPAMADMSLGLATAPLLYAAEEVKELRPLIKRRFKEPGDKEAAFAYVLKTDAIARSRALALWHAQRAVDAAARLPPSPARQALINVCHTVLTRNK
ncbi:isoprenoid synthase domain-containing protein [Tribonema minus]|uniref:Isoprenoid synthase domain-containing protein n=1 Tax=Tribonema minus TaxID=303371 RepID=A0A835YRD5_9STRA|nr:isoprenoid synthase domain-containing protein [Tribonema minus]